MTTYDIARICSLEKTFKSTRLFDRFVRLGVGNFGRDSIWKVGVSHSRSGLSREFFGKKITHNALYSILSCN